MRTVIYRNALKAQKRIGAAMRDEVEHGLNELGFETWRSHGAYFHIKGISIGMEKAYSQRTEQITAKRAKLEKTKGRALTKKEAAGLGARTRSNKEGLNREALQNAIRVDMKRRFNLGEDAVKRMTTGPRPKLKATKADAPKAPYDFAKNLQDLAQAAVAPTLADSINQIRVPRSAVPRASVDKMRGIGSTGGGDINSLMSQLYALKKAVANSNDPTAQALLNSQIAIIQVQIQQLQDKKMIEEQKKKKGLEM